jgi:hypothetical protein
MYGNVTLEEALSSVGEGWAPLIREVFEKKPAEVKIQQVKEKFGVLRIYASDNEFERTVIREAETKSKTICEWCGKPGSIDNQKSWILTLCDEDKEKRKNNVL